MSPSILAGQQGIFSPVFCLNVSVNQCPVTITLCVRVRVKDRGDPGE